MVTTSCFKTPHTVFTFQLGEGETQQSAADKLVGGEWRQEQSPFVAFHLFVPCLLDLPAMCRVCLRDRSAWTILYAATQRKIACQIYSLTLLRVY